MAPWRDFDVRDRAPEEPAAAAARVEAAAAPAPAPRACPAAPPIDSGDAITVPAAAPVPAPVPAAALRWRPGGPGGGGSYAATQPWRAPPTALRYYVCGACQGQHVRHYCRDVRQGPWKRVTLRLGGERRLFNVRGRPQGRKRRAPP